MVKTSVLFEDRTKHIMIIGNSFFNCWYGTLAHSEIQFKMIKLLNLLLYFSFGKKIPLTGSGGIRTHVIEMTGT